MPRELFIERRFSSSSLEVIENANEIIAEYQAQGFTLTLRQLYYQFVSRALIENKQTEYKRLGSVINDGRLAGLIDWEAIEDRTRNVQSQAHWRDASSIIDACAQQFRHDLWASQPYRVEVWIEKDALIGVVEPVCTEFDVPYFACRGYSSQSEQWRAGRRFRGWMDEMQDVIVLHLGDHDPSGIDMSRDNRERLDMFSEGSVDLRRLALNMDQVIEHAPPPNPAKMTDSRAEDYVARFGTESWELDALSPTTIDALIRAELNKIIDHHAWRRAIEAQRKARAGLRTAAERWSDVVDFLGEE